MILAQRIFEVAGLITSLGVFGAGILAVWLNDHVVVSEPARAPARRPVQRSRRPF